MTRVEHLEQNVKYPDDAVKNNISGKVVIAFSVDEKGKVVEVKVLRGVYASIDAEAIRAIESSPEWIPAKDKGVVVKQQFVIPIVFQLSK